MKRTVREYFKVIISWNGSRHVLETYTGEYRSLMALIYDKIYIEDFGECKGIGRCGTCHVHVLNDDGRLLRREGNENTTLHKMNITNPGSRLACQVLIDRRIDGLRVAICQADEFTDDYMK